MGEHYTRPPLVPREAPETWIAIWRFRLTALALLVLVVVVGYTVFEQLSGATSQDPGISNSSAPAPQAISLEPVAGR